MRQVEAPFSMMALGLEYGAEAGAPSPDEKARRQQMDEWPAKMSELMLKGWKMLGENCPVTGTVPLMQHPKSARKFLGASQQRSETTLASYKKIPTRIVSLRRLGRPSLGFPTHFGGRRSPSGLKVHAGHITRHWASLPVDAARPLASAARVPRLACQRSARTTLNGRTL